ncbi:glutaminyl-peptide cyclotransferase-like protein [Xylogone sp. PMI_703]|nr:glutaminyl-peptide cyclotransferase-like protein [Xylogone sp. PMI_703]
MFQELHYLRALFALLLCALTLNANAYTPLSEGTLRNIPSGGADFDIKSGALLAPILIPRVSGTSGSETVQRHFVDFFTTHLPKWKIEFQNSTSTTPATGSKQVPFSNIIITRDPPWSQPGDVGRLNLVAHFDSKLTPAGFIGATDSAAPCAIIMHVARSVDEALTRKWAAMEEDGSAGLEEEVGIQILFLDGEEAFVSWTDTDSLYGARSLAEAWEATPHPALSTYRTALSSISLFVLLDLLGSAGPIVPSYFKTTHWAYQHLANIELRLRSLSLLQSHSSTPFLPDSEKGENAFNSWGVQDDHLPFMARGVEVLHIIPSPFPVVWHKMADDGEHLDIPTVQDWSKIFTAFVGEWMDLEGYFPALTPAKAPVIERQATGKTEL